MMIRCAALLLAIVAASARAEPAPYRLDADNTRVHFEVLHFGTSTSRGRFDKVAGSIQYDPAARRGEVSIEIDTASVSTGIAPFDSVLRRADMLATQAHPKAWFVSRRFVFDGERLAGIEGDFTLRGITRSLVLQAAQFGCRPHPGLQRDLCGGDFEAELKASEFGLTYALPFTSDRIRLVIQVEATRD
jgi:polyisoprenoid-binding protein YceI